MNFLVMDPSGQYETGDVVTWSNKLVLRNRLTEEGGRAHSSSCWSLPWATSAIRSTAANRVKGTLYDRPVDIGDGEVLLRAFAAASGLEAKVEFRFPPGQEGVQIDDVKPGRLVSRTGRRLDSRAKTFEGLKQAGERSVSFENVTLTVGQGAQAVQVMIGEIRSTPPSSRAILEDCAGEV